MKPLALHIVGLTLAAGLATGFAFLLRETREGRRRVACRAVQIEITDSLQKPFVTEADVRACLETYGTVIGQRMTEVNLSRIEDLLDHRSAIRKSEAFLTRDGVLHITVTQREPFVKFRKGEAGFYADRDGFLFPLMPAYVSNVPLVEGEVPLNAGDGFKGEPALEKERMWLSRMIAMIAYMNQLPEWAENFKQIEVLPGGDLVMIPFYGNEKFIFGKPEETAEKFRRIQEYYEYIAPSQLPGCYGEVDVRFSGQIVCRKDPRTDQDK